MKNKGFTLTEFLITLAIIAALIALIGPVIMALGRGPIEATPATTQPIPATWAKVKYDNQEIYYAIVEVRGREFVIFDKPNSDGNIVVLPFEQKIEYIPYPAEAERPDQ